MLPLAPIISSLITFLEAQSLCNGEGVVSILKEAEGLLAIPLSPYLQLAIVAFGLPSLAMAILIFPFADGLMPFDLLLAIVAGLSFANIYAAAAVCGALLVRVGYRLHRRRKEKGEKDDCWRLVGEVRDFYMIGISEERGLSIEEVSERVEAFLAFGRPSKVVKAANVVVGGALGIGACAIYLLGYGLLYLILATAAAAYFLLSALLSLSDGLLTALSSLTFRLAIVILEVLYILIVEEAVVLLHPVAYCPLYTTSQQSQGLIGNFSQYTCSEAAGWRLSTFGYPAIDYVEGLLGFLPLFAFILLVVVAGVPLLEVAICHKSRRVIDYSYTIGEKADGRWQETVASLKTSAIYTFFLYKREHVLYPPLVLFLKAASAILSHLQKSLSFFFMLPIFYAIHLILSLSLRPFSFIYAHILDIVMHACNIATSLLVAFGVDGRLVSILKAVASAMPIAGWAVVFVVLLVKRKKREKEEEMVVDDVVEEGEVVRERMEKLYDVVGKVLEKEILHDLVDYSWLFTVAGGLSFGFFIKNYQ